MFKKWKEEWFLRNQKSLETEFQSRFENITSTFDKTMKEHEQKYQIAYEEAKKKYQLIIHQQDDINELSKRLEERKLALNHENEELKIQLKIIEAKSSPSNVWVEAFTAGFNKAWDMILLQNEGFEKVKKLIEDKAISETLGRLNGNNKKNH